MSAPASPNSSRPPAPASSSELAARVLHDAPVLIAYIDPSERICFVNDAHQRWFGIAPEKLVGKNLVDVMDKDSYRQAQSTLHRALAGHAASYEGELFSGVARRYVHGSFQPDLDEQGNLRGVITAFTDITARYTLERKLRESELRFQTAFQHAAIGMALISTDGHFMRVNQAVCRMLGYSEDEFLKLTLAEITHPDDLVADMAQIDSLVSGRAESCQIETRNLHRDGHVVHLLMSVSVVRDPYGEAQYLVSQAQDISQHKAYADALHHERQLSEITLNSIADAVISTDLELKVVSLNPIAEAMTGWSAREALGRHIDEVFRLRSAVSGQPLENPLSAAIRRNAIVDLSGKAVLVHRNGFETPIEDSAAPIADHNGNVVGGVLVCHDIGESRSLALKLIHFAQHDTLTGLPNRNQLTPRIEQAVTLARHHKYRCALLYLDVDHFRNINDTLGRGGGDQVMQAVARQVRSVLRRGDDLACRYSADEFVVLLPRVDEPAEAAGVARALLQQCSQIMLPGSRGMRMGVSVGISLYPDDADDADALLRNADAAMYEVKMQGRRDYRFFTPSMTERHASQRRIEGALRQVMEQEELSLYYQPKVNAADERIVGAEALLRWQVEGHDIFVPDQFIPVAEDSGLILSLGDWVLRQACEQASRWQRQGLTIPISVNVSPRQFQHEAFYDQLEAILDESGLDSSLLELELTERMVMSGGDATIRLLQRIRERGVRLSLDDFGTGYCSLSYLKHFPVDALKIDRAFVRDIVGDADTHAITGAIISMARSLNKDVIAEGVETAAQSKLLRDAGCSQLQGFLYGAPMSAETLERQLAEQEAA
ncbi:EAL domain-containing protein [Dyella sp. A6]|uniref:sensor domain-containing protein n=1 Tax=Dyella aluminiiresistens TaxID=3069105 RepID=UPI002E764815|nr:EAL domain-containing protein [Dyella sp. A6]